MNRAEPPDNLITVVRWGSVARGEIVNTDASGKTYRVAAMGKADADPRNSSTLRQLSTPSAALGGVGQRMQRVPTNWFWFIVGVAALDVLVVLMCVRGCAQVM